MVTRGRKRKASPGRPKDDMAARIAARRSRSKSNSRSPVVSSKPKLKAKANKATSQARSRRSKSKKRKPTSTASPKPVYRTPTKNANRTNGTSNSPSWQNIAQFLFLVGCLLFSLYLVSPPGVQKYAEGSVFISDGHYGLSDQQIAQLLDDDADYGENDHYGVIDILAPKNANKMCLMFWNTCRDWYFVQCAISILSILLIVWGLRTDYKRDAFGRKIVEQNYETYQVRSPGLLGLYGHYDRHLSVSERTTIERKSPLAVKCGVFIICGIGGWACVNSLFAFDLKGFAVAGAITIAAYRIAQVHLQSNWTKKSATDEIIPNY